MEENSQLDLQEKTPLQGSGSMLAAARKRQNRSVEEIADELNLSVSQIRTIELDQNEGLPEPTYVRGYIRSYANLLGMDADEVLRHYLNQNWQKSASLEEMPRGIGGSEESVASLFSPLRVMVFLLLAGGLIFAWYAGIFGGDQGQTSAPSASVDTSTPSSSTVTTTVTESSDNAEAAENDSNEQSAALENTETAPANVSGQGEEAQAAPASDETSLQLSFAETSWVDIRDEEDNRLAYKSYPAGDTLNVSGKGLLSVFIGNAQGVSVLLNGQAFDISQYREGVYAKFTVGDQTQ